MQQIQVKSVHEYYNTKHYQQHKSGYYMQLTDSNNYPTTRYLLGNCLKHGKAVCFGEEAGNRLNYKHFGKGVQLEVFSHCARHGVCGELKFCN